MADDNQAGKTGNLYSAKGARDRQARKVRGDKGIDPSRFDFSNAPRLGGSLDDGRRVSSAGFSPWLINTIIYVAVAAAALLEMKLRGQISLMTDVVLIAVVIGVALKARPDSGWAVWTAVPLSMTLGSLLAVTLGGKGGGLITGTGLGLLTALSDNMWVILGLTTVAAVLMRRRYVQHRRSARRSGATA